MSGPCRDRSDLSFPPGHAIARRMHSCKVKARGDFLQGHRDLRAQSAARLSH